MKTKFEKKKIGRHLYLKSGSKVVQVKGPYRPGNVWMATLYDMKPEFEVCWQEGRVTPVERGRISAQANRVIAAMTMGDSAAIDPELVNSSKCLGYLHKTQKKAIEKAVKELEA